MKMILPLVVSVIAVIALIAKPARKYRGHIISGYAIAIIALSLFYNVRTMHLILPFYKPTNQLFYQPEFIEDGEYPDSLLPSILNGKTVLLPQYLRWRGGENASNPRTPWEDGTMICMNIENVMSAAGANIEELDSYDFIKPSQKEAFDKLGIMNDTFRYSFFHNDIEGEQGNSFYYYWFYGTGSRPIVMYVCGNNLYDDDKLYLLVDDNQDLYLISKDYYDKEVSKL